MPIPRDILDRTLTSPLGAAALGVAEKLEKAGHECWWVGGAVRDILIGKLPNDIDMAISCSPEEASKVFPKSDTSAAVLGAIVVSHRGHTFELTTFRKDHSLSDGRRPASVEFGSLEDDARRRDATVNAIYWDPVTAKMFDPFGGEKDLKERLVRFIGDPSTRVREDALRILRMIRLRASLDGQYEPETYASLRNGSDSTKTLSGVRVLEEIEKILSLPRCEIALEDLLETGVLKVILPEVFACKGVAQPREYHHEGDVWEHLKQSVSSATEDHGPDVRLAAFLHDIGKAETFVLKERIRFDGHATASAEIASKLLARLQVSKNRIEKIDWLIRHHMMMASFKEMDEERKAHWYFHPWFSELLQLFCLDASGTKGSSFDLYDEIVEDYDEFLNAHPRPPKPYLNGEQVMEILGIGKGPKVGEILEKLYAAQLRKEINSKSEALKYLKELQE